jgi:tetratricopeptide (TPR) repeat protein
VSARPARKEWTDDSVPPPEPRVPRRPPTRDIPRPLYDETPSRSRKKGSRRPKVVSSIQRSPLPARPAGAVDLRKALAEAVGPRQAPTALRRVEEAKRAFAAERYDDARRTLAPLARMAKSVPEVRELFGLTLYRLRKWEAAVVELEAFREMAGSPEQNPVLADAYRALKRWSDVEELWHEVRDYSPSGDLVNEGRIVAAGALADQGDLRGALALLEKGWELSARPREHQLRRGYALADLYERSGASVKARELFRWIATKDPGFADAAERAAQLR